LSIDPWSIAADANATANSAVASTAVAKPIS
jgi:hypothetical protein